MSEPIETGAVQGQLKQIIEAALLANNFPEAGPKQVGVLMYAALVLLLITLLVNMVGAVILQRASKGLEGMR